MSIYQRFDTLRVKIKDFAQAAIRTIKKNPFLAVLILVLIAGILGNKYGGFTKKSFVDSENYIDNVLVIYDASLDDETSPSSISIQFNYPVPVHHVADSFSLTPKILGRWEVDKNDSTKLIYKFNKRYKGSYISFTIAQGVTSFSNKALLDDYYKYFTLESGQYEQYARVKSFPVGKEIRITDPDSITVYKSNAYSLLSFLQYTMETQKRGSIYDGVYSQEEIKHSPLEKLNNIKMNKEDSTISLDPGVYYIEDDTTEPYFIVVSSFGVALRQDDKRVVVGAFHVKDGTKINDPVTFGMYNLKGGVNLLADFVYTDSNNSQPLVYPTRLDAVIGIYKDEVVFIPVELPSSFADIAVSSNLDTDAKIFVYTDRPIYKPGDTVFIRGVVRQDSDSLYKPPFAGRTIYLQMDDYQNTKQSLTTTVDEYGTFYTNFVLPKDYEGQFTYIQASAEPFTQDYYRYASTSFEVLKYTKPEFEIKTNVEKDEYLRSDKLKFTISGNYFNGNPLENKEISYSLYTDNYYEVEKAVYNKNFNVTSFGGMCGTGGFEEYFGREYKKGTVTLNSKGEAVLEVSPDSGSTLSQKVTLVAEVVDNSKNKITSGANTIVHGAQYNIFFIPSTVNYTEGEEAVIPFYAESLTGEKVKNKAFSYKLIDYEYATEGKESKQTVVVSGEITTDDNGKGIVTFTTPTNKTMSTKQLIISTKDSKNNTSQNQKSIVVTPKEDELSTPRFGDRSSQTYLKISSNQNSFKVNDTVKLSIESPKDLDVLLTFERGRIYNPQFLHLNKGNNSLEFRVTDDLSPSITVVFSFFADGSYKSEGLSLNVPAMHKLLQIDLTPNKKVYNPSETAELVITTKDADGAPVAAQMSVGVVDKAIYALRKSATPPIHSSFYYFRLRRTNASSSLTGMGDWGGRGGGGGGGGGIPGSNADVLYWNPNLRTDVTGKVTVPIPLLGHKTIWKVQVMGSTINSQVGQADTEFTVTSDVKGAKTNIK